MNFLRTTLLLLIACTLCYSSGFAGGLPPRSLQISGLQLDAQPKVALKTLREKRDFIIKVGLPSAQLLNTVSSSSTERLGGMEIGLMMIKNKRLMRGIGITYYRYQTGAQLVPAGQGEPNFYIGGFKMPGVLGLSILNSDHFKLRAFVGGMLYITAAWNDQNASIGDYSFENISYGYLYGAQFAWKFLLVEGYMEKGLSNMLTSSQQDGYIIQNATISLGARF